MFIHLHIYNSIYPLSSYHPSIYFYLFFRRKTPHNFIFLGMFTLAEGENSFCLASEAQLLYY